MNTGLLILRLTVGLLLASHGIQKVSKRLGGRGLNGGIEEFRADGFRGGALTAVAAGGGQILAGLLFVAGALTPLAALTATGVMSVAVTVKWHNGPWVQNDGYEYPLMLIVASATLAFTGSGRWAVDPLLGQHVWPAWVALAAVLVGLFSGLMTRLLLHAAPQAAGPAAGRSQ